MLTSEDQGGKVYELGGDERLTYVQFAEIIAETTGKEVAYQDLSEADYAAALVGAGLPDFVATMLSSADAGISRGELDTDSGDLQKLIGRPSTPVADVLKAATA